MSFFDSVKYLAEKAGMQLPEMKLDPKFKEKKERGDVLKQLMRDAARYYRNNLVDEEKGKIGEKIEMAHFECLEAPRVFAYNHHGNRLATLVAFDKENAKEEVGHNVAMQVAAMNPIAVDKDSVPAATIENEKSVAREKTKQEQVQKAVDNALSKAGINPAHVDSEEHIESNTAKGWLTPEQAQQAREIIATVSAEKAANIPEAMLENIVKGRVEKFYKENTLMHQEYIMDSKMNVGDYVKQNGDATVVAFRRLQLGA